MWVKRPHVGSSPKMIFTILTFKKGKYVANIIKTLVKCPYLKQEKNVKYHPFKIQSHISLYISY